MLGSKTEIFLLLILFIPTLLVPSFAEDDSLIVETDKAEYEIGDSMIISGLVGEIKMPVVALKIFDPNGGILSANEVDIEDDNTFSKIIELDSPFYDEQGIYSIALNYVKLHIEIAIVERLGLTPADHARVFHTHEMVAEQHRVLLIGVFRSDRQQRLKVAVKLILTAVANAIFGQVHGGLQVALQAHGTEVHGLIACTGNKHGNHQYQTS